MGSELHLEIVYENNLDTDKFARMFNNKAQSYKFYWFEAILNLTKDTEEDLTFEEIIDEMICRTTLGSDRASNVVNSNNRYQILWLYYANAV